MASLQYRYAPVSDDGSIKLAYIDSDPVPNSEDYTTLVCIHGMSYNSENFKPLLTVSHAQNVRGIAVNRRDYRGSTPFSPSDHDLLTEDPEAFLVARARETVKFLLFLVKEGHVKKAVFAGDGGTNRGGIVVLGWSAGNTSAMGLLAFASRLEPELRAALEPYLRGVILWDPAVVTLGAPTPPGAYSPTTDPTIPALQRSLAFGNWISSHFGHADHSYPPTRTPPALSYPFDLTTLSVKEPLKSSVPIVDRMPFPELQRTFDALPSGPHGSEFRINRGVPQSVKWGMAMRALFDKEHIQGVGGAFGVEADGEDGGVWPRVTVGHVYGLESSWGCVYAGWDLRYRVERAEEKGTMGRKVRILEVEGANHFFHYEEPERALKVYIESVN